jgi:AhpD family alkylhydroperoxidase
VTDSQAQGESRTLVRLVERADAPPEVQAVFDSGEAQYGKLLNTWRALANRPEIFTAYLPYLRSIVGPGALDQRLKELVEVKVAVLNHCRYSVSHRLRSARAAGVTEEDLVALARDELDRFSEKERVAIEYARELTVNPPLVRYAERPGGIDPGLARRLQAGFSDPELVELTATIGLWNALARFHRALQLELDMDPPPPEIDVLL